MDNNSNQCITNQEANTKKCQVYETWIARGLDNQMKKYRFSQKRDEKVDEHTQNLYLKITIVVFG